MKPSLADVAAERLANASADEPVMAEDEVLRVLARIARRGKLGERLRAVELIGKHLGMFKESGGAGGDGDPLTITVKTYGQENEERPVLQLEDQPR